VRERGREKETEGEKKKRKRVGSSKQAERCFFFFEVGRRERPRKSVARE